MAFAHSQILVYGDSHVNHLAAAVGQLPTVHFEARPGATSHMCHDWQWSVILSEEKYTDVILVMGSNDGDLFDTIEQVSQLRQDIIATGAKTWIWVSPQTKIPEWELWKKHIPIMDLVFVALGRVVYWQDQKYLSPQGYMYVWSQLQERIDQYELQRRKEKHYSS